MSCLATLHHSVAVVGAVIEGDRALCIQRADNRHWEAPAGVLEKDESLFEGVAREVLEETGYTVQPLFITGVHKNHAHPLRPVSITIRCRGLDGDSRTSDETVAVEWLSKNEVRQRMTTVHAARLLDAWEADAGVVPRSHDGIEFDDR